MLSGFAMCQTMAECDFMFITRRGIKDKIIVLVKFIYEIDKM